MTSGQLWQLLGRARPVRRACGISATTICRAFGVSEPRILQWETGLVGRPRHPAAFRYARIVPVLAEHDRITRQLDAAVNPRKETSEDAC